MPNPTTILTLRLDSASQERFHRMRQEHFPAELNRVPAHLTLFHTLPPAEEIVSALREITAAQSPFSLRVTGLRSLGRGVAYTLASEEAQALHRRLAELFAAELTPQDRQRFAPHVVIQNKTTSERARHLLATLQAGFSSFQVQAEGLDLWDYLGGPWRLAAYIPFGGLSAES